MLLPLAQMLLTRMSKFPFMYTNAPLTDSAMASISRSYSTLRSMAQIALELQRYAPPDPLLPAAARVPSSFCTALDTVSTHEARVK